MPTTLFTIEVVGAKKAQEHFEKVRAGLRGDRLIEPWQRAVELLRDAVSIGAPYWHGDLQASINEEVIQEEGELTGVVFSDLFKAPILERGTAPYWPNIDALEEWALEHETTAFVVARYISDNGIKAYKYFEKALEDNKDEVHGLIGDYVARIIEKGY